MAPFRSPPIPTDLTFVDLGAFHQAVDQHPDRFAGANAISVAGRRYDVDANQHVREHKCWFFRLLRFCFGDRRADQREAEILQAAREGQIFRAPPADPPSPAPSGGEELELPAAELSEVEQAEVELPEGEPPALTIADAKAAAEAAAQAAKAAVQAAFEVQDISRELVELEMRARGSQPVKLGQGKALDRRAIETLRSAATQIREYTRIAQSAEKRALLASSKARAEADKANLAPYWPCGPDGFISRALAHSSVAVTAAAEVEAQLVKATEIKTMVMAIITKDQFAVD